MKKALLLFGSLSIILLADLSVHEIQSMVGKIHQKREGVLLSTLESTKEPFVRIKDINKSVQPVVVNQVEKGKEKLVLHSIINNKAFINDQWRSVGDKVLGYTLKHIGVRGVVLRNNNTIKKLFLRKERDKFIIIEER